MAGYIGALQQIALSGESVRGTAVAPSAGDWVEHNGFNFAPKNSKGRDTSAMGRIEELNQMDIFREWSEGTIPMNSRTSQLPIISSLIMGNDGTTASKTTSWVVTNTNAHKTATINVIDSLAGQKRYAGCMLDTFTMDANENAYPTIALELKGKKEATTTGLTASYTAVASSQLFKPTSVKVYVADNFAGLTSATAVALKNLSLTVNKNLGEDFVLGSTEPADWINQRLSITGTLSFKYDSDTYRTLGLSDTKKAIRVQLTQGNYVWNIDLPSVGFIDWNSEVGNDNYMLNTVGFEAERTDEINGTIKMSYTTP